MDNSEFEDIKNTGCEVFITNLTDEALDRMYNGFEKYGKGEDIEDDEDLELFFMISLKLYCEEMEKEEFTEDEAQQAISLVGISVTLEKLCRDGHMIKAEGEPGFLFKENSEPQKFTLTEEGRKEVEALGSKNAKIHDICLN